MSDVSKQEGRTVLYVSHNMNTIRQLCDRVIVLDHGKVVFDGDVEEGISVYMDNKIKAVVHNDFTIRSDDPYITGNIKILYLDLLCDNIIKFGGKMSFRLTYQCKKNVEQFLFRFTILKLDRFAVATTSSQKILCEMNNLYSKDFEIDVSLLAPGDYQLQIVAFEPDGLGQQVRHDYVPTAVVFSIFNKNQLDNFVWSDKAWGNIVLPQVKELN